MDPPSIGKHRAKTKYEAPLSSIPNESLAMGLNRVAIKAIRILSIIDRKRKEIIMYRRIVKELHNEVRNNN